MYCPTCGGANDESASFCKACGGSLTPETSEVSPNYLAQAILVTIFCCLPFGIVSIVYAAKVNGLAAAGQTGAARDASDSAKMWAWISFGIGIAWIAGVGVYAILGPIGIILFALPALVALAIWLLVRNSSKGK